MQGTELDREERIRRAMRHLRDDTTDQVDEVGSFTAEQYTDPDLAKRERDLIFGRVPTIVAHASEIPKPNDFLTLQMPRNKIIVVRQKDGSVRSFVNLCRHRGALLEDQKSGRCRLFSCPYHRWSYNIDGSLRAITRDNTFGEIDHSQYGLVELPTEERHGFIWVVDSADAKINVAGWLGTEMEEIVAGYNLDQLYCVRAEGFDQAVNWKIMQDAFLDGYHIQYAHPNSAAKHIHTNVLTFEDFGRHCRFVAPRKTIDRWLDEDPGDQSLVNYVTETHFLGPNSTLLKQPSHFELLTFRPDPVYPDRGVMEMRLLVPTVEDSGMEEGKWQHIWNKNWEILLAVLHEEDFPLLRDSQEAMSSQSAGPMLLGRNEVANHVFHREVRRMLAAEDSEL